MAEITAVKAFYPLLFISTQFCASLQNYEIIEDGVGTFCLVCLLIVIESGCLFPEQNHFVIFFLHFLLVHV